MSEKRLKTLNLDKDTVELLDAQPNASKYARMAIKRYRDLLNEVAHQTEVGDRNWQDLKIACSIIHMMLRQGNNRSSFWMDALQDALDMDDFDWRTWERDDENGHGVDYVIGRVRDLGRRERL